MDAFFVFLSKKNERPKTAGKIKRESGKARAKPLSLLRGGRGEGPFFDLFTGAPGMNARHNVWRSVHAIGPARRI
jgi:hypothetical protein